jgi:hypothetical protein
VSELGVEKLATRAEFTQTSHCPTNKGKFIKVGAVTNAWIRELRVEAYGGEAVVLDPPSKWVTVEDATYVGVEGERCDQFAFNVGGQQNLIHRSRSYGAHVTALITGTEVEGPNAVVDFLAVGKGVRVRVNSRWSTGILFDNVRVQDSTGQPSGDFDLARGRRTYGWSAVNSVIWNSEAEVFSADGGPTKNFIIKNAKKPEIKPFYDLCFGPKPSEELYDITADVVCMKNLADDPQFASVKADLSQRLEKKLRDTNDPRIMGKPQLLAMPEGLGKKQSQGE